MKKRLGHEDWHGEGKGHTQIGMRKGGVRPIVGTSETLSPLSIHLIQFKFEFDSNFKFEFDSKFK